MTRSPRLAGPRDAQRARRRARPRVLNSIAVPTLVVIDYAETRLHQLAPLEALTNAEVRSVATTGPCAARAHRTGGPFTSLEHLPTIGSCWTVPGPTPEGRAHAWDEAAHSSPPGWASSTTIGHRPAGARDADDHLGSTGSAIDHPRGTDARLGRVAAARAPIADSGDQPEQVLLAHERRYCEGRRTGFGVPLTRPTGIWSRRRPCGARPMRRGTALGRSDPAHGGPERGFQYRRLAVHLYGDEKRYWSDCSPMRAPSTWPAPMRACPRW